MRTNTLTDKAYIVGATLISTSIIYFSWGQDAPIFDFALTFGGILLGHVLTLVLDDTTEGDE